LVDPKLFFLVVPGYPPASSGTLPSQETNPLRCIAGTIKQVSLLAENSNLITSAFAPLLHVHVFFLEVFRGTSVFFVFLISAIYFKFISFFLETNLYLQSENNIDGVRPQAVMNHTCK
jgi:hypothetical protein